jgi:membrane-bound ClpP family serine protease
VGADDRADSFLDALDEAKDEDGVQAIVVRIDSPGGEVYASHLMWRGLKQAAEELPVVASFSDLAASGGYYMAMGADTILADDATLTGSIGVVGGQVRPARPLRQARHQRRDADPRPERGVADLRARVHAGRARALRRRDVRRVPDVRRHRRREPRRDRG